MLDLAQPWFLALAPLPFILRRLLPPRASGGGALDVPESIGMALSADQAEEETRRPRLPVSTAILWAIWGLIILALSGPRDLAPVPALKVTGRDLAIVLDLSGSMVRDDFYLDGQQISRYEAVTRIGADFARRRGGDRVALIVFGSQAYYAAPFTFDVEAIAHRIETATIGISGRATNISDGLGLALKRMALSEAESRVVILLSDGVNNMGATEPRGVASLAAEMGVRVHSIALGPKDLTTAQEGERGVVDAATLRAISDISGGETFRVKTTEDLISVTQALDRLESTDSQGLAAEIYRDYWIWPAALAAVLSLGFAWREGG